MLDPLHNLSIATLQSLAASLRDGPLAGGFRATHSLKSSARRLPPSTRIWRSYRSKACPQHTLR